MNDKFSDLKKDRFWLVCVFFVFLKLSAHFLTHANYELHRDEMLYFNMGSHPDYGFASVPPLIGLLAWIVKSIFGFSVFGIKLLPALAGAASIFIIAKIVRTLGGNILALCIAAGTFLLSPAFLLFDSLFTPNVFEQFFWLLITYFIFRLVNTGDTRYWLTIGILTGLSFLTKYSVIFLIAGFILAMLFSPYRKLLYSRNFFISILIAFFIFLPNIIWQYNHGWPVLHHMSELKKTQLSNMNYATFFKDLFSLHNATSIVWIFGLAALLFAKNEKTFRYLGIGSLLIILLFLFSRGKAYYTLGIIPFLIAFGGYAMEKYLTGKLRLINVFFLLIIASFSLIGMPFSLPILSFDKLNTYAGKTAAIVYPPFYRWEDGKTYPISQVYADMTGWKELTGIVANTYLKLTEEEKQHCTIYAQRNYGYAGAIHFYGKEFKLPEPVTFLESYVFWAPDTIPLGPMIYVHYDTNEIRDLFKQVIETGEVSDPYFREKGVKVFLCKHPVDNIRDIYAQKAKNEKRVYQRKPDLHLSP